jgi:hypothetical protein
MMIMLPDTSCATTLLQPLFQVSKIAKARRLSANGLERTTPVIVAGSTELLLHPLFI